MSRQRERAREREGSVVGKEEYEDKDLTKMTFPDVNELFMIPPLSQNRIIYKASTICHLITCVAAVVLMATGLHVRHTFRTQHATCSLLTTLMIICPPFF